MFGITHNETGELFENMLIGGVGFIVGSISTYILGRARGYRLSFPRRKARSFS